MLGLALIVSALPTAAYAKMTRVYPGQSIQAAVDAASPGDEIRVDPGVYQEQVVIDKSDITLTGAGASESGTVLTPPATRQQTACSEGTTFQDAICVLGNPTADDVTVKGILIRGFPDNAVITLGTSETTVREVWADANGYGLLSAASSGARFERNIVSNSRDIGLWVTDSPVADASVTHNEAYGNRVGILALNSSHGTIKGNHAHDNGIGIAVSDAGRGASDWRVTNNRVNHNNTIFPENYPFPGAPAVGGSGISLQGATATLVKGNEVLDNTASVGTFAGGIEVHSTAYAGGSDPIDDVIQNNRVHGNAPYDLIWDGTGNPVFKHNACDSSDPSGLCR